MNTAVILRSDRLSAEALRLVVQRVLPDLEVRIAASAQHAVAALAAGSVALFITGLESDLEADVLDLVSSCINPDGQPRVLVITAHDEGRLLTALHGLPVHGVFDVVNEDPGAFEAALRTVMEGGRYWSKSVREQMRSYRVALDSPDKTLTVTEQIVLSVLGDGSDDAVAADTLGLSPSTICTIRRNLHRKLRVHHRGELVRVAVQNGFVRFTSGGVVRPGYSLLAAAYRSHRKKGR